MHEEDVAHRRKAMVDNQLIARGISDRRVLEAFLRVPRHLFVPKEYEELAYQDSPLPIGSGQTISQPYIVALMLELLELQKGHRVLEIGTGSGYQTALLAELVSEVYSVERIPELLDEAKERLRRLGYTNVFLFLGDGSRGLPEFAPYDRIVVSACARRIYDAWVEELKDGGCIVLPLEDGRGQSLIRVRKSGGQLTIENHGGCVFVPLIEERQ
ncbi:MAG: protein-L-isoaspartate(D-aspartate) O-methyltransferase [Candidatus Caldatribacterium sp.]|uniref:protein-L-isoaspartate(D-aspartate) O-methyltransferase n=1 Tax=Candidatus Caldatribacterium sp. TaxID=2282143 RepID=UPI00299911ED|nr:protein-L-isoaspartate(D-aspartate) O-methyltransferase [Candidatus Caldatribacterium sp.]MCX7730758.1 protein-L-isoaspartate(D-aspartate) O-methyltransferase [Candidatus Caldatribacterium sp.]MDW8081176.1 protein-L-isoaspartate(D-aspartate) O-methyltransferase [Candidatus Calescibacterium sp.]